MSALDIPERQILVRYYDSDFEWHHRVLYLQINGPQWVWGTPDADIGVDMDVDINVDQNASKLTRTKKDQAFNRLSCPSFEKLSTRALWRSNSRALERPMVELSG